MIVRIARAKVRAGKEKEWEKIAETLGLKLVRGQAGLRDVVIGWNRQREREFVFETIWDSLEDVKRFAGDQWQNPVILPEERPILERMTCEHYEPLRAKNG